MVEETRINVGKTLDTQNINIHVGRNENKIGDIKWLICQTLKAWLIFPQTFYYYHYNIFQQKRYRLSSLLSNTL